MIKRIRKMAAVAILVPALTFSTQANALIPVFDAAAMIQNVLIFLEAVSDTLNQIQQIENQINQIKQLDETIDGITGAYGMGTLFNTDEDQAWLNPTPGNWRETLDLINSDNIPDAFQGIKDALDSAREITFFSANENLYTNPGNKIDKDIFHWNDNQITGGTAAAYASYSRVGGNIERIQNLMEQIETAPDVKAATDLNTRMMAETNNMIAELQRTNAQVAISSLEERARLHNRLAGDAMMSNSVIPKMH